MQEVTLATANAAAAQSEQNRKTNEDKNELGCSLGSVSLCITQLVYVIGPGVAIAAANIGARIFGTFARLSLMSDAYALDFLSKGWNVTLAIANIAFLFILIYFAIVIMLEAETSNTTRMLATFVIMALLVNFSFFFTRVVIDGGNILGTQFYNAIMADPSVTSGQPSDSANITTPVMKLVGVQTLLGDNSFKSWFKNTGDGLGGAMTVIITLSVLYICIAIALWILAFIFFQVGIKFLIRIVSLWFAIIGAPLAFAARVLTNNARAKKLWDSWRDTLVQYSLYPAVFLFIYYILVLIMNGMAGSVGSGGSILGSAFADAGSGTLPTGPTYSNLLTIIANVFIRLGIVVALFYYGLKVADSVAAEGNKLAQNISGKLTGFAAGTAGKVGRNTIGWGAHRLAESNSVRDWASRGGATHPVAWR